MPYIWNLLVKKKLLIPLIIILAFAIPIWVAPPKVVVFTIDGYMGHEEVFPIISALDKIQNDALVKVVVLSIDSPGGSSEAVEEIYYKVLELKDKKPLVVSINSIGASGAYYISSPADYIFSKPSSEVGAIGLIAELPEEIERPDLVTSGPFKIQRTKESVLEVVDLLKKSFLKVVYENRGDKLKVNPIELSSAEIYIGIKAKEMGLVDELGGLNDAISKAASLAGLVHYTVVYVNPFGSASSSSLYVDPSKVQSNSTTVPKFYHLYINLGERQ